MYDPATGNLENGAASVTAVAAHLEHGTVLAHAQHAATTAQHAAATAQAGHSPHHNPQQQQQQHLDVETAHLQSTQQHQQQQHPGLDLRSVDPANSQQMSSVAAHHPGHAYEELMHHQNSKQS